MKKGFREFCNLRPTDTSKKKGDTALAVSLVLFGAPGGIGVLLARPGKALCSKMVHLHGL